MNPQGAWARGEGPAALDVLQVGMQYFVKEFQSVTDKEKRRQAIFDAANIAEKIAKLTMPRLVAAKIVSETRNPLLDMTPAELRAAIIEELKLIDLDPVDVLAPPAPTGGIANRDDGKQD